MARVTIRKRRKYGPALTWDELARDYDAAQYPGARPARTLPMWIVSAWAARQHDKYVVDPVKDTFHRILLKGGEG